MRDAWPMPGTVIVTLLMLRGAWALYRDFRRWEQEVATDYARRARGEFVTDSKRRALEGR